MTLVDKSFQSVNLQYGFHLCIFLLDLSIYRRCTEPEWLYKLYRHSALQIIFLNKHQSTWTIAATKYAFFWIRHSHKWMCFFCFSCYANWQMWRHCRFQYIRILRDNVRTVPSPQHGGIITYLPCNQYTWCFCLCNVDFILLVYLPQRKQ